MDDFPYESIVEESNDGILVARNGEIIYANERLQELTGYAEATLVGAPNTMLVTDDETSPSKQYQSARTSGEGATNQYEATLETRSDTRIPVEFSVNQIPYDGEPAVVAFCRDITEQNEREEGLDALKPEYESVFDHVQDALFLLDVDDDRTVRFQRFNEREEAFTGKSTEEVRGKTPTEVFGDELGSELAANYRKCIERRETLVYEEELNINDKATIWQTKLTPIVVDGTVERIVGSGREITELKNRERELEQARTRLRALFDEAPDSITVHDADGNILDVNEQIVDELGYTRDKLLEMNVTDFAVELDPATAQNIWAEMDNEETHKVEGQHQRKDGSTFPVEMWVSKTDVLGEPQYLALGRNITERKEREKELSRYRAFVENTSDVITIISGDGTVEYVSSASSHVSGHESEELVGTEAIEHVHPADREAVSEQLAELIATPGSRATVEYRFQHADGSWIWIESTGINRFDDPKIEGVVLASRDITGRKERERQIQELKDRLALAIEGAELGVWDWNVNTDEVEFNDQWAEMLGYDPANIDDHLDAWETRVHPEDLSEVEATLESHLAGETEYYDSEHRMKTADGGWKWIRDIGKVVERDDDGDPVRAVGIHLDIDERKSYEQTLEEERDMFTQGPAVLFKWENAEGWPVEFVSENVENITGYSPDQFTSGEVSYAELVHDADIDRVTEEVAENSEEGIDRFSHEPYRIVTADGDVRWVLDHTKNVWNDREITHRQGYLVDITERKRREQKLEQFREAVEQTGHAVYITDTDGSIEYVNPAFEQTTGYSEDEVIGERPTLLKSGEHEDTFYEDLWETVRSGNQWESEIIDKRADGEEVIIYQTISPIADSDGEPQKFVAVARDITERKEYEEALEAAHEKLRQIIDLVPDLIFVKNRAGEYLLANETTADFYGMSPEAVEGSHESEVIPSVDDSEQFRQDDLEVIESGEPKFIPKEELTTADGETRILQTTKIPYQVPESGEDAVLGYARDVTDLTEYQHKLESQRDNLEILNQVVRHDIRNDLQLVLAYAETLLTYVEPEGEENLDRVLNATRDAIDITTTARDVTRVMLQSDVELRPVRLRPALESEVDDVQSNYEEALVRIDGTIPNIEVLGDGMLESVFRNLMKNAIQHNDKEVPEVNVSVTQEEDSAVLRIADNGPGISDERKEKIFQQGEMGLDSEGTGLGLHLVETLVDRYGGSVYVEDNDATGAVFVVELPLAA
nr:PAS domain S-box protein [Salinibaculum sp. KK48]